MADVNRGFSWTDKSKVSYTNFNIFKSAMGVNYDKDRMCTEGHRDPGHFIWTGERCSEEHKFICERKRSNNTLSSPYVYRAHREKLSMTNAKKVCAEWRGQLVTMDDVKNDKHSEDHADDVWRVHELFIWKQRFGNLYWVDNNSTNDCWELNNINSTYTYKKDNCES